MELLLGIIGWLCMLMVTGLLVAVIFIIVLVMVFAIADALFNNRD